MSELSGSSDAAVKFLRLTIEEVFASKLALKTHLYKNMTIDLNFEYCIAFTFDDTLNDGFISLGSLVMH